MANRFRNVALVNPPWDFERSKYWSCRDPHVPLELLYAEALLRRNGIEATVIDAHIEGLSAAETVAKAAAARPDLVVLATAPTYLFWRCPPPELDVPSRISRPLGEIAPVVAIGPHGSATPGYVLDKLGCSAVIRGEPELEIAMIALGRATASTVWVGSRETAAAPSAAIDVSLLPTLDFAGYPLERHLHRHHVFWGDGLGAEVEFSRGCPYGCTFCNRKYFRSRFRSRPIDAIMSELRALRARGVDYVYFIDEVFGLGKARRLLDALEAERPVQFGCQTRLDLWDEEGIDRLAAAGCISVEFGLESPFPDQQRSINKGYEIEDGRILELMVYAKARIPWVQGDLLQLSHDPESSRRTEEWRQEAVARGVWVSEPVDPFLYPGSDLHEERLGRVDDRSWERALEESGR